MLCLENRPKHFLKGVEVFLIASLTSPILPK